MIRRAGGFRALGRNSRGATIIEFALIAPAFIALLLAIIETSLTFFAQESLETAAEAAARTIATGQVQTASTTQTQFHTIACKGLYSFMSCGNLIVDVQKSTTFAAVDTSMPTLTYNADGTVKTNYTTGGAGDIVVLRLMYIWSMPLGPLNFSLSNIGGTNRLLVATTVAKTEPYS